MWGEALGSVCFLETLGELEVGVEGAHLGRGDFRGLLAVSLVLRTTCLRGMCERESRCGCFVCCQEE